MLAHLHNRLLSVSQPFTHAINEPAGFQQYHVLRALLRSHLVVLVESPGVHQSRWVRLELAFARITGIPIVRLPAHLLSSGRQVAG
jgi:hypothetical protein